MEQPLSRRLALALALLVLAGCTRARPGPAGIPEPEPERGGTLRVLLTEDVDSLDPHRGARPSSWFFARAVHRGLLAFPDAPYPTGARPVPDLAAAMPSVDDTRTIYTFTLREARFAGARDVTATDVRASIMRVLRRGKGVARFLWDIRGARAYALGRARSLAGVRVVDPRIVEIRLLRPLADLTWILAHPQLAIIPSDTPFGARPQDIAGAGPYRITRYDPEQRVVLERNDAWRRELDDVREANVDRIEASVVDGSARAYETIVGNEADLVAEPGPPDSQAAAPVSARVATSAGSCIRYAFADPRSGAAVAQALRAAVAASGLRRDSATSAGATSLLPPVVFAGARRPVDVPRPARVTATIVVGDSARDRRQAKALQQGFARTASTLRVRSVPAALLPGVYADGRASVGLATWCADWPGLAARNVLGAISGVVVRSPSPCPPSSQLRAAVAGPAAEPQLDAWSRADAVVQVRCGVVPIAWPIERSVISARLRGFGGSPMFPRGDPTGLWLG